MLSYHVSWSDNSLAMGLIFVSRVHHALKERRPRLINTFSFSTFLSTKLPGRVPEFHLLTAVWSGLSVSDMYISTFGQWKDLGIALNAFRHSVADVLPLYLSLQVDLQKLARYLLLSSNLILIPVPGYRTDLLSR